MSGMCESGIFRTPIADVSRRASVEGPVLERANASCVGNRGSKCLERAGSF